MPPPVPAATAVSHKGTFGRVVIFAGSTGMAGAAAPVCTGLHAHGRRVDPNSVPGKPGAHPSNFGPCATCIPLPEHAGQLSGEAAERLRQALEGAHAAAVGCGLGQGADVLPLLHVMSGAECPVVWDADALNLLAATDAPARKQGLISLRHTPAKRHGCWAGIPLALPRRPWRLSGLCGQGGAAPYCSRVQPP